MSNKTEEAKRSAENGILRQLYREAKSKGWQLAVHDGYEDEYLSEFGGTEKDFIEAAREVDDVAVHIRHGEAAPKWLAWIVWGNEPCELFADTIVSFEEKFPLTELKIQAEDRRF